MTRMRKGDGVRAPGGRYACGCRLDVARGTHGGVRVVPACGRHGEGLALRTAFVRALGRAVSGFVKRGLARRRRIVERGRTAFRSAPRPWPHREIESVQILGHVLGDVQL